MVTIRSRSSMKPLMTLSKVVLPVPVPPLMRMLQRRETAWRRNSSKASSTLW